MDINIEKNLNGSFLIISDKKQEYEFSYEHKMFLNNKINGFLYCEACCIDSVMNYKYNIS